MQVCTQTPTLVLTLGDQRGPSVFGGHAAAFGPRGKHSRQPDCGERQAGQHDQPADASQQGTEGDPEKGQDRERDQAEGQHAPVPGRPQ